MKPKISALMPVFNRPELVRVSADSIMNQSFTDWELIIVDDGSDDETRELLNSYKDERITLVRLSYNTGLHGIGVVRNIALSKARGKYIAICDSDDIKHPYCFAIQSSILESLDTVGLVGSRYEEINVNGNIIKDASPLKCWRDLLANTNSEYIKNLYKHNRFCYSSVGCHWF